MKLRIYAFRQQQRHRQTVWGFCDVAFAWVLVEYLLLTTAAATEASLKGSTSTTHNVHSVVDDEYVYVGTGTIQPRYSSLSSSMNDDDDDQEEDVMRSDAVAASAASAPTSFYYSNVPATDDEETAATPATTDFVLDGMAFDCGGGALLLGFKGLSEVYCMNSSSGGSTNGGSSHDEQEPCGEYSWDGQVLQGVTDLTGPFRGMDLLVEPEDGVLMSFTSLELGVTCHVVSLDWESYSTTEFLGIKCPAQNYIDNISFQRNHFSFGVSGDVALRSPLELVAHSPRSLIRDSYGVYKWTTTTNNNMDSSSSENVGKIKLFFGPQQGQPPQVLEGTLSIDGKLFIDGYVPPGPCVYDGQSPLQDATTLTMTHAFPNEPGCGWTTTSSATTTTTGTSSGMVLPSAVLAMLMSSVDLSLLIPM